MGKCVASTLPVMQSFSRFMYIIREELIVVAFQNWEVVNSAILTGKQVSQGMKVVMVSHGGHLADVTLQASCHVPDDSVIKVCLSIIV